LEKVWTRKYRSKTAKQRLAKQMLNKDLAICVYSCFAVPDPFSYFERFNFCV